MYALDTTFELIVESFCMETHTLKHIGMCVVMNTNHSMHKQDIITEHISVLP
jgi:hypothetical protein